MTYAGWDAWRQASQPWVWAADTVRAWTRSGPLDAPVPRLTATWLGMWADVVRLWPKPAFNLEPIDGLLVDERVVADHPFCMLRAFHLDTATAAGSAPGARKPKVLLVAPLSGNHATLLRDTVAGLVVDHDVFLTDWRCASQVPTAIADMGLDDFVLLLVAWLRDLEAGRCGAGIAASASSGADAAAQQDRPPAATAAHLIAVCQPGAAALAAASLLAAAGDPATPASLTIIGGPIDPHRNPMLPNRLAQERDLAWFEQNLLATVPRGRPGSGRRVYPGFLQHTAFLAMKPFFHVDKHLDALRAAFVGDRAAVDQHDSFYAEFRATIDLPARFYIETIDRVFQRAEIARGTMVVAGEPVRPEALVATPLLVVEGENDDITGPGQAAAALDLCTGLPAEDRHHHLQVGVGHMGLFSGSRWRSEVLPRVARHVATAADRRRVATAAPTGA